MHVSVKPTSVDVYHKIVFFYTTNNTIDLWNYVISRLLKERSDVVLSSQQLHFL
jgi:hypothetical protein